MYACVVEDARWDWQVDSRAGYLAGLITSLELPLAPIERHLEASGGGDVQDVDLALAVLAVLPFAGRRDAAAVLRRYLLEGAHWTDALEKFEDTGVYKLPGLWDGFADGLVASRGEAAVRAVVSWGREPWTTWARSQPAVRRIVADLERDAALRRRNVAAGGTGLTPTPTPTPVGEVAAVPTPELVRRLWAGGFGRRLALEELGRRGEALILDFAEDPGARNAAGGISGMPRALRGLGAAAVPRARAWVATGDDLLAGLGVGVLAGFGGRGDIPTLLDALSRAIEAEQWCVAEAPARGLGRLRAGEAGVEALVSAWEMTARSLARRDFLAALRDCAPGAAEPFAEEGLYDCEPSVQQLACGCAADNAAVRARLAELAVDPVLSEVHEAANARLASLRGGGVAGSVGRASVGGG